MAKELVPDELWEAIEPLLPEEPPKPKEVAGPASTTAPPSAAYCSSSEERHPLGDAAAGDGLRISGMTCWRRLKEWHEAGVWARLHETLLDRLGETNRIDWGRASLDSAAVAAPGGAKRPARTRRIAANRARSATLWSTEAASRSR